MLQDPDGRSHPSSPSTGWSGGVLTEGEGGYPGFGDGCINRQRTTEAISPAQRCRATSGSASRPAVMGWAPGHPSGEPDFCRHRRPVPRERPAELGAEERGRSVPRPRRPRARRRGSGAERPGGRSPAPLLFQCTQRISLVLVIS